MNGFDFALIIIASGLALMWNIDSLQSKNTDISKFDMVQNLIEELDNLRDDYMYELNETEKEILDNKIRVREETLKTLLAS
jgi:hypothetical protein